jgi:formate C-acetyltransferase
VKLACPTGRRNVTGNGGSHYELVVEMTSATGNSSFSRTFSSECRRAIRDLTSHDQVWKAFCVQVRHLAWHVLVQQHVALKIKPQFRRARDVHAAATWR